MADALMPLLLKPVWLLPVQREGWANRFRTHVNYVAPDGGYGIVVVVWQPGQTTPIHHHVSWCFAGVYKGVEEETGYLVYEKDGERFLAERGTEVAHPGRVATLVSPEEDIHRIRNAGSAKAFSIHVYGANIGRLGSSINQTFEHVPVLRDPGDASRVHRRR